MTFRACGDYWGDDLVSLMGGIPFGYADAQFPLNNVASAGVSVRFSLARAIFGFLLLLIALALMSNTALGGVIMLLLAASLLANALSAALVIVNNGGGATSLRVSFFEKSKLEAFRAQINHRLFADHEGMRHNEVMGMHAMGLRAQQQAMQQQAYYQQQGRTGSGQDPLPMSDGSRLSTYPQHQQLPQYPGTSPTYPGRGDAAWNQDQPPR